jgi:hypothetical protein
LFQPAGRPFEADTRQASQNEQESEGDDERGQTRADDDLPVDGPDDSGEDQNAKNCQPWGMAKVVTDAPKTRPAKATIWHSPVAAEDIASEGSPDKVFDPNNGYRDLHKKTWSVK